jgi:hypothetical protein
VRKLQKGVISLQTLVWLVPERYICRYFICLRLSKPHHEGAPQVIENKRSGIAGAFSWLLVGRRPVWTEPKRVEPALSWFSICLGWVALGLINARQVVVGMRAVEMRHNWSRLFFVSAVS